MEELQRLNKEDQEVYTKFIENQDTLEWVNLEVERLRCCYEDFDTLVEDKIEKM